MKWWLRIGTGVGTVLCATALVLVDTDVVDLPPWLIITLAAVTSVAASGNAVQSLLVDKRMERLLAISDECQNAFAVALGVIETSTGPDITYENIGFNCWVVPAWYRRGVPLGFRRRAERLLPPSFFKWLCKRRPSLRRVKSFRLTSGFGQAAIEWTYGKGALGMCWAAPEDEVIAVPCYEWYHQYVTVEGAKRAINLSKDSYYDEVPRRVRAGLTYEDFCAIAGKYGAVLVAPMKDRRGDFLGCVTADVPWGDYRTELDRQDCRDALVSAANWIAQAMGHIDGQANHA